MATAIFMFAFSVVGVGVGPTLIGLSSDTAFAGSGDRALGWSIMSVQVIGVWSAFHYWIAMKTLPARASTGQSETYIE